MLFIRYADALALLRAPFGQGNGSILERTYCSGSELKLIDCSFFDYPDYYGLCHHGEDAGVRCCKQYCHIKLLLMINFCLNQCPVIPMVPCVYGEVLWSIKVVLRFA